MPALKNAKHEAFARALLKGMTAEAAYIEAGYAPNRGNATRLKQNDSILKRLKELQETVTERVIESVKLERQWIIEALIENAEACLGRRKVKRSIKTKDMEFAVEVEEYDRDPSAANAALKLLGQIPEVALWSETQATEVNVNVTTAPQAPEVDRIAEIAKRFAPRHSANDQSAPAKKSAVA